MQPIDKDFTPVEYDPQYILMVNQLKKYFPIKGGMVGKTVGQVKAVDGVTFNLKRGTTMGLVGESGCGKTTTGRTILRLSGEKTGGQVLFNGKEVYDLSSKEMRKMRTKMQIIFQDPSASLDPRMTVGEIIGEALDIHKLYKSKQDRTDRIKELLGHVGLNTEHANRYPHEFSGGQQQRVAIARALVNEPKVLLLDEPLGALDAKIRKQMQVELKKIQQEVGITFIYVTHDQEEALSMSDTVVVMNNGEIQQIGSPTDIYNEPENRFVAGFIGESNIIEGTMIRDYLVAFDGFEFECVDKGFEDNEEIEVVLRPEDLDIVDPGQAKIRGIVRNITFKGVHYEILIETELRTYMVHTTDYAEVGREVGLKFGPEDIHVMCKMGSY